MAVAIGSATYTNEDEGENQAVEGSGLDEPDDIDHHDVPYGTSKRGMSRTSTVKRWEFPSTSMSLRLSRVTWGMGQTATRYASILL